MKDIRIEKELKPIPEKGEYKQRAIVIVASNLDRVEIVIKQEKKRD